MNNVKLDFEDVLIVPQATQVNSRSHVELEMPIKGAYNDIYGVPIIAANMDGVGALRMADALAKHKVFTAITKSTTVQEWKEAYANGYDLRYAFATVGLKDSFQSIGYLSELSEMSEMYGRPFMICADVANGYMDKFVRHVADIREVFPQAFIIAGTVCTPRGVSELIRNGADMARVGIGTGAVCLTRQVAGVGYPQFSAIQECSVASSIVSDGGCVYPGDFAKAFGAGASMVMAGSIFAGHDEGGMIPDENGNIEFYGMSSSKKIGDSDYRTSEGRIVHIASKGPVDDTIQEIFGGIRSACSYTNCSSLKDFIGQAEFIQVNRTLNRVLEPYTQGK